MLQNRIPVFTVFSAILFLVTFGLPAEYIFNDMEAFGQYPDIGQIMAEKIILELEDNAFEIYYGYKGSLDSVGSSDAEPILSSMSINEERKSMEITMEHVPQKTDFWVRIPPEVLDAEDGNFVVVVDGVNTGYDLTIFPNDYAIGFIILNTTENIEIIGTEVIPEFGFFSVLVLGISVLCLVYVVQRIPFGRSLVMPSKY